MLRLRWDPGIKFRKLVLEPEPDDRRCSHCGEYTHIYEHRDRRLYLLTGAIHLVSKIAHCMDKGCPGHQEVIESAAEMSLAPPFWTIGWDVFAWMGHRRFARNWSVPQIRAELADSYGIAVSPDLVEDYVRRYQAIVAARESAPELLADAYRNVKDLVLTIDGLQPEKGHETLYVVRELRLKRVWFATPLLSSSGAEVKSVLEQTDAWAKRLGKPVRLWISDKQKAFVTGIAEVFAGVPHRYCSNHFLRDLAKPVLERDSHAKVQMRRKVRGLREVERRILEERRKGSSPSASSDEAETAVTPPPATLSASSPAAPAAASMAPGATRAEAQDIALEYAAGIRGILNDDQGGPLDPPGLRMAEALAEVRASLQRCVEQKKGGPAIAS
ncbi:MAG TPA: hypothetical protein VNV37_02295 [Solirubrobacteraceae bacterium]|jgi:hypothetical protein|nr:hypothetical protein [Solirubrobacteraceae bacterium]